MRFARTSEGVCVVVSDGSLALVAALVPEAPRDLHEILAGGPTFWAGIRKAAASAAGGVDYATAQLLAPLQLRRDAFCVGWNYADHMAEGERVRGKPTPPELRDHPTFFSKGPDTVVGPMDDVFHPSPHSDQLDWEAELAVVIGHPGRDIRESAALTHVFGYTAANDLSVRDVQRRHGGQWFKGKNFDSHLPLGPVIVTADEFAAPPSLRLMSRVNGTVKQDSSTGRMAFGVARIIAELSAGMALLAGDVILTGTPEGVGYARTPPEFLAIGDVVEVEVEGIGVLRNHVVARG